MQNALLRVRRKDCDYIIWEVLFDQIGSTALYTETAGGLINITPKGSIQLSVNLLQPNTLESVAQAMPNTNPIKKLVVKGKCSEPIKVSGNSKNIPKKAGFEGES